MKTFSAKPSDISREWLLIDASEATLGRMSTKIATYLTGKGKPQFTQHIDCGDFVVVINNTKNMNKEKDFTTVQKEWMGETKEEQKEETMVVRECSCSFD